MNGLELLEHLQKLQGEGIALEDLNVVARYMVYNGTWEEDSTDIDEIGVKKGELSLM